MMDRLLELAERCEKAEGPDRELGREVLRACGWTQASHGYFLGPLTGWTSPDLAIYFDDDDFVRCRHDPTASLDAAMSLVPEGWTRLSDNTTGREIVELFSPQYDDNDWVETPAHVQRGSHPTSYALALCAAALRARASQ